MQHQTTHLDHARTTVSGIIRTASENAASWFTAPARPKLETFCEFQKKNGFRFYRIQRNIFGETTLSVKTKEGPMISETARNLHLAFIKLQRNFYGHF